MAQTAVPSADDRTRAPRHKLEIDWSQSGAWTDESKRLLAASGSFRLAAPNVGQSTLGSVVSGSAKLLLRNHDGRFSPDKSDGPLAASIATNAGRFAPVRLDLGFLDGRRRVFTGVILKMTPDRTRRSIMIECADRWALLNRRLTSTPLYQNKRVDELVSLWLAASGFGFPASLEVSPRVIRWAHLERDRIGDDLNLLMEADGGLCYFDEDGTLVYRSPVWWALNQTPVYTFTTRRFEDLEVSTDYSAHYDAVICKAKPRYTGQQAVIWQGPADLSVGPGETRSVRARFANPAIQVFTPVYSPTEADSDWIPRSAANEPLEVAQNVAGTGTLATTAGSTIITGTGTRFTVELAAGVVITAGGVRYAVAGVSSDTQIIVTRNAASTASGLTWTKEKQGSAVTVNLSDVQGQSALLTLVNNSAQRAYLDKLQLRGQPLLPDAELEATAGDTSGDEILRIDNFYIQRESHAQAIADGAKERYAANRRAVKLIGVPGQPHLRLGDRVRVKDLETRIDYDFTLTDKEWTYSPSNGYRDTYEAVDSRNFALYSDYFIIGTSKLGGAGVAGSGRLYY